MTNLFGEPVVDPSTVAGALDASHYLGRSRRAAVTWSDEHGIAVLSHPASRRLPSDWLELARWCLVGERNAGSRQWASIRRWLLANRPDVTTVVSYSDPSVGHTGALYRACGWLWAPTWMVLRPPPSAGGSWDGERRQSVKDRWVDVLRSDERRAAALRLDDAAVRRRFPDAEYREPTFRRGRPVRGTGGGRYVPAAGRIPAIPD